MGDVPLVTCDGGTVQMLRHMRLRGACCCPDDSTFPGAAPWQEGRTNAVHGCARGGDTPRVSLGRRASGGCASVHPLLGQAPRQRS